MKEPLLLIWAISDSPRLSEKARKILLSKDNTIYYSFANVWEIAIKHSLQKSNITFSSERFEELCRMAGYLLLETHPKHAFMVETLRHAENAPREHRDPFDRLLLAQAKSL